MNDNEFEFYLNSSNAWDAMIRQIECAKKSIFLEHYIFSPDIIGRRFADALIAKAKQGLKVLILCDAIGSFGLNGSKTLLDLESSGVTIRFFNPLLPWKKDSERILYFRDHRKLLIIDEQIGFTGSVCLAEEMKYWRETYIETKDKVVVSEMIREFFVMWNREYMKTKFYRKRSKIKLLENNTHYVTNSPLPRKRFVYYELLKIIKNTKSYLYLTTPYFLPNHRLLTYIKRSLKKKINVVLLVPKKTDHRIVDIGAKTFFQPLLVAGAKIFLYDGMIHSKTFCSDGHIASLGSLNLDNLSLRYNFEANIISTNNRFVNEIESQFLEDLKNSKELTLEEWKKRGLIQRIKEMLVFPIRKFL